MYSGSGSLPGARISVGRRGNVLFHCHVACLLYFRFSFASLVSTARGASFFDASNAP